MNQDELPALHRSADALANQSQKGFFLALGVHVFCLIVAAALSVLNSLNWQAAVCQALVMLLALACSVYLAASRPDKIWYLARAVAESIKTMAWRYVCRAEPFNGDDAAARAEFRRRLRSIIEQNPKVTGRLTENLGEAQVSNRMEEIRFADHASRVKTYAECRIRDQLTWYISKQRTNAHKAKTCFALLIASNVIAVVLALMKIRYPSAAFWPTDIVLACAGALLTWMQARRYSELSASYATAATDISLFEDQLTAGISEGDFSTFVGDAENAFSREHTLWIARQDAG